MYLYVFYNLNVFHKNRQANRQSIILTWVGTSPSSGNLTQFLHILVTMSSLNTTISCVQYCILHGLLVKMADGILRLISSVMEFGIAGLKNQVL